MSEKRGSASLPIKKRKLDGSASSSGSASDVKQGGEAAMEDPPPTEIADILDSLSASVENKPRKQDDNDNDNDDDDDEEDDDDDDDDDDTKFLVYRKSLTLDEVLFRRLVIPLEDAIEFMPEPSKYEGKYKLTELKLMDHKKRKWNMKASFDELSSSYLFSENWDKYLNKYELEPEDVIFLYEDSSDDKRLLIEFHRRKLHNINPKKFLVYKKSLTRDDVFYRRLVIPLADAVEFLPQPSKYRGRYEFTELKLMDHEKQMWNMRASFYKECSSYLVWENWDKYLNKYELEPEDVILFYEDPIDIHFHIEFQKRKPERNNNPKDATD